MKGTRLTTFRRGIALVWVALLMVAFIGFLGLIVDYGWMALVAQRCEVAADSAALAGAQYVRTDDLRARSQAETIAAMNHTSGVGSETIELGQWLDKKFWPG